MSATIKPATRQEWRVLWYEVQRPRAIFRDGNASAFPVKPTRRQVFTVQAFTHDEARRLAVAFVLARGVHVVAANTTTRPHEFVVYTKKRATT